MDRNPRNPARPEPTPYARVGPDRQGATTSAAQSGPVQTTPMTAIEDGLEHHVVEEELRAGSELGWYQAVCSVVIRPVALTMSAGMECRRCALEAERAAEAAAEVNERGPRWPQRTRRGWLRRLRERTGHRAAVRTCAGVAGYVAA